MTGSGRLNFQGFKDQNSYKFCGQLTCGLRISSDPTTDNLTPQETTSQDAPDMGVDGAGLSCPGSNVVAITNR